MSARPAVYPWSAVVGQPALKRALLLCALDPAIGGVLVKGPRGVGKTTLARALCDLFEGPFVELPLGASEERITGTLDLDAALRERRAQFSPGLLARAHGGVLYVDEVNLLADGLVDLLLDAAASGRSVVERDGVSHAHAARFVLIGTMNPEEGELRPQLLDRFGLCVSSEPEIAPEQRVSIVRQRLEFDRDPEAFLGELHAAQAELRARCVEARARLAAMPLDSVWLERVSALCHAARVEGVRADLAMLRAARAHAAWHGRAAISEDDVAAVSELALVHRRPSKTEPSGGGSSSSGGHGRAGGAAPSHGAPPGRGSREAREAHRDAAPGPLGGAAQGGGAQRGRTRPEAAAPEARAPSVGAPSEASREAAGERGAMPARPTRALHVALSSELVRGLRSAAPRSTARERSAHGRSASRRRTRVALVGARGRRGRAVSHAGPVDWCATLLREPRPQHTSQLVRRVRYESASPLWVLVLDCSASMLRSGALAGSKGLARALETEAARSGAHVVVISFRGAGAQLEISSRAGRSIVAERIAALGGGGGTPLRRAVEAALRCCEQRSARGAAMPPRILLLTDGRSRDSLHDLPRPRTAVDFWVVDCERGPLRLALAVPLAAALGARYHSLDRALEP